MERLTKKYYCFTRARQSSKTDYQDLLESIYKKLSKYEDIEEKYEIDDFNDLDERLHAYKFLANHEYSCVDVNAYNIMLKDLDKYHKFIKIIKREPNAVIKTITTYDSWEELCKDYPISDRTLWHIIKNKAEFDLLKEILQ